MNGAVAIISPRTNGMRARNLDIYNFAANSWILKMGSFNDFHTHKIMGGK